MHSDTRSGITPVERIYSFMPYFEPKLIKKQQYLDISAMKKYWESIVEVI